VTLNGIMAVILYYYPAGPSYPVGPGPARAQGPQASGGPQTAHALVFIS